MKALRRDRVCDVCGAAAASAVTVTPARVREEQRNRGQVGGQACRALQTVGGGSRSVFGEAT